MNELINNYLTALNSIGRGFCSYTAGIFIQSSVLIVLLLIIDFLLRRRVRAVFRYCVWMLVFVKLILPPTLSLPTGIGYWYGDYLSTDSPVLQQVSNMVRPEPAGTPAPEDFALAAEIPQNQPSQTNPQIAAPVTSGVSGLNALTWQAFVFLLWFVGVLVISVLLVQRMSFVKGLIAQSEPVKNRLVDMLNQCRRKVGIRRNIELRLSNNISCPAVCGLFKPVILIPAALLEKLSPDRLRAVLIHELVHIKRADIWVNLVQTVLQIIYFYNPFVWLANAVVRRVREQAVDEMVLVALGAGAKSYSNTLIDIAEMAFFKTSLSLRLIGVVESKKALHRRIRHMLNRPIPKSAKVGALGTIVIIIIAAILLPMAKAQKSDKTDTAVAKPARHITLRQVWSGGESPWYGKISPDGRYFSFVDEGENAGDLAILELATGNIRRLTNMGDESENYEYAFFSRWSPDGKQIVYEYEGDFSELRVVGLDGSGSRILYRDEEGGYVRPHDWSPDGKQVLAFLGREGTNQIVLISVGDGSMRVLKTITHGEHPYHWGFSPDGRYIVYESPQAEDSLESDIFLFSIDEKREVPIVEHPANDKVLGWAPDSDWLLFVSDRTGSGAAWAISVAEGKPKGNPELIKKGIDSIYPMGFTKNGAFYYTDSKRMNDIYSVTMNPETGKIDSQPNTLPILDLGGNHNPQYSPDGKYLAYTRNSSLCILSLETSKVRKFPLKLNARYLRWSPDRHYILFNSIDVNRRSGIYRLEVQTGNIIPISLPKKEYNIDYEYSIFFNEWSHDGKSFFYVECDRKNKLCKIINRDFETGNEKELYQGPEYLSISLSPDGQWLAFTSKKVEGEIKVMPASGGEPRELCKIVQPTNCPTPLAWTADGRYVLFSTVQADAWRSNLWLSNLWRVPIEGGKPQKLGLEMAEIYNLTVHPNGRQIAFLSSGSSSKESEIWVMENFLPAE